jgi:hypothetical protein
VESDRRSPGALPASVLAAVLVGAAAAAIVSVATTFAELRSERAELLTTARALGVDAPAVVAGLRRTEDPERQRARLARVLVVRALSTPEAGPGFRPERLAAARELGRRALARRPASWEAATALGTATFLQWLDARDPRLLQEYGTWEEPLLLARRLAPHRDEPVRYLATAYLELWPFLSGEKRELARELLARAFEHQRTFDRLVEPWLRIAGDDPDLLSVLPREPRVWRRLREIYGRRGEWRSVCVAWEEERRLLHLELARRLSEAERLLDGGELLQARQLFFSVLTDAPRERRFVPYAERALRLAPHGPGSATRARAAGEWLRWSVDLCGLGECPFSRAATVRLASELLSGGDGGGPELALAAWGRLVGGERRRAERLADRGRIFGGEPWGPYLAETSRLLIDEGHLARARTLLEEIHPTWRDHPIVQRAWRELARSAPEPPPGPSPVAAPRESWPATAWDWRSAPGGRGFADTARLEIVTGRSAPGAAIGVRAGASGAVLQVLWDGASLGCFPWEPGVGGLTVDAPSEAGLHLLEVRVLGRDPGGDVVSPGAVRLLGPEGP